MELDGAAPQAGVRAGHAGRDAAAPGQLRYADQPVQPRPLHGPARRRPAPPGTAAPRDGLVLLRILDLAEEAGTAAHRPRQHRPHDRHIIAPGAAGPTTRRRLLRRPMPPPVGLHRSACPWAAWPKRPARALCAALQAVLPAFSSRRRWPPVRSRQLRIPPWPRMMARADLALAPRPGRLRRGTMPARHHPGTPGRGGWRRRRTRARRPGRLWSVPDLRSRSRRLVTSGALRVQLEAWR